MTCPGPRPSCPGGPHLERLASSGRPDAHTRYPLTIPLANGAQKDSCNFSFSGLKTQVGAGGRGQGGRRKGSQGDDMWQGRSWGGMPRVYRPAPVCTYCTALDPRPLLMPGASVALPVASMPRCAPPVRTQRQPALGHCAVGVLPIPTYFPNPTPPQAATLLAAKRKELRLPDLPLPPALAAAAAEAASGAGTGPQQEGEAASSTAAAGAGQQEGQQGEQAGAEAEQVDPTEAARLAAAEAEFQAAAADIAASFQRTAVRFLQQRTRRALQWLRDDAAQEGPGGAGFVRALVVAGGVAANAAVRRGLGEVAAEFGLPCVYPPVK